MTSDLNLINTIKILCLDYLDFEGSPSIDQIKISDEDNKIFGLINEISEDIIYEYLSERIDKMFDDDLFLDVIKTDSEKIKIEIQKVTVDENEIQKYYRKLYQNLSHSQIMDLILTNKSKEEIKDIIGSSFEVKGDLLIAEEETAFFTYEISFDIKTLSDIKKKNQELDQILNSINNMTNLEKEDLFQVV